MTFVCSTLTLFGALVRPQPEHPEDVCGGRDETLLGRVDEPGLDGDIDGGGRQRGAAQGEHLREQQSWGSDYRRESFLSSPWRSSKTRGLSTRRKDVLRLSVGGSGRAVGLWHAPQQTSLWDPVRKEERLERGRKR